MSYEEYVESIDKREVSSLYKKKVDLDKVKEYVLVGLSDASISRILDVHPNTLYNWKVQGAPFSRREYELIKSGGVDFRDIRPYGYNSGYTPLYNILTLNGLDSDEIENYMWDLLGVARNGYTTKESRYVGDGYYLEDITYGKDARLELDVLNSLIRYKDRRSKYELERDTKLAQLELDKLKYENRLGDKAYEYELKKELYEARAEIRRMLYEDQDTDGLTRLADLIESVVEEEAEGDV